MLQMRQDFLIIYQQMIDSMQITSQGNEPYGMTMGPNGTQNYDSTLALYITHNKGKKAVKGLGKFRQTIWMPTMKDRHPVEMFLLFYEHLTFLSFH